MTKTNGESSDHVRREHELQTQRRLLEYAVSRAMSTGRLLDVQRAVLLFNDDDATIMDASAFDAFNADPDARWHREEWQIVDGRQLYT